MKAILGGVLGKIPIPTPAMVVALLALFIAASGTAVAAISFTASDGTITACRDNKTGVLKVIQSGQSCASKETPITWKDGITGKVADADKLDGKDSSEFADKAEVPGADSATVPFLGLNNSWQKAGSVTVTAPADGFAIVTASGTFNTTYYDGGQLIYQAALGGGSAPDLDTEQDWTQPQDGFDLSGPEHDYLSPFSITKMYPVTAGDNTFYLWGSLAGPETARGKIHAANITVQYVKNRY